MSVCVVISIVVRYSIHLIHIDVGTAFLNGILAEDIYLKPYDGLQLKENEVLKTQEIDLWVETVP